MAYRAWLSSLPFTRAAVLLAINEIVGDDRTRDFVPGEVSYLCQRDYPGRHRDHSYEGNFSKLREAGLIEFRLNIDAKDGTYYKRVPDPRFKTDASSKKREVVCMCHWWTDKGWEARNVLLAEARRVVDTYDEG